MYENAGSAIVLFMLPGALWDGLKLAGVWRRKGKLRGAGVIIGEMGTGSYSYGCSGTVG